MFYVFDRLGDDVGHYKTLRGAIAGARRRSAAHEGARYAVVSDSSEMLFETCGGVEKDAAALAEQAKLEFEAHLAKSQS